MRCKKKKLFVSLMVTVHLLLSSFSLAATDTSNTQKKLPVADLKGHWAEKQIQELIDKGLVKGTVSGSNIYVKPKQNITRAEFIALLTTYFEWKPDATQSKKFKDVKATAWYASAIGAAVSQGITSGYPDGSFKPENTISRAEIAMLMAKALKISPENGQVALKPYKDVTSKDWYYASVMHLQKVGLINGYADGRFLPANKATRAEAFTVLYNTQKNQAYASQGGKTAATFAAAGSPPSPVKASNAPTKKPESTASPKVTPSVKPTPSAKPTSPVSRGERGPQTDLKPLITIGAPFVKGQDTYETQDVALTIAASIQGNYLKDLLYSIWNDNGSGKQLSVVAAAYPVIQSVVRETYTAKMDLLIPLNPIGEDLNIIKLQGIDIFGNEGTKTIRIMRMVDTDADGISNFDERAAGTNLNNADTDGDGLSDYQEMKVSFTHPLKKDTDGDGLTDQDEVVHLAWKTSPTFYATVGSGISDAELDLDGDGLSNKEELQRYGTNPSLADSDGDGLADGAEVFEWGTNPNKADSNGDGAWDIDAVVEGKVKNIKMARATIQLPTLERGLYELSEFDGLDKQPMQLGDKRTGLVLRLQYFLNRLQENGNQQGKSIVLTGAFDPDTRSLLQAVYGTDVVDDKVWEGLIKQEQALEPVKDVYAANRNYLGYASDVKYPSIREFKSILEAWRQKNAPNFKALYGIPSMFEADGSISNSFDSNTVALLKLFQLHQGLQETGKINDATAKALLSPLAKTKLKYALVKPDILYRESFGKHAFFRYVRDAKLPLDPVYYSQLYGPWSKDPYYAIKRGTPPGGRVIEKNGCGPTATAMVIATLADRSVDPGKMAKFSMENDTIAGYDTEGRLYPLAAKTYGLYHEYSRKIGYVQSYLAKGTHLAIASMNPGHFTGGGHLIVLMGVIRLPGETEDRIIVYDSNTGNNAYGNDGSVILSKVPGIVFAKPNVIEKEQALGFWLIWK